MRVDIAVIVEGDGEVLAVPNLLQRIKDDFDSSLTLIVPPPIKISADKIKKDRQGLAPYIKLAASKARKPGAVLILVDGDDDCPAALGPTLLGFANSVRPDLPISVVVAKCEYEGWFLAAAESLQGREGFPDDLQSHPNPEGKRDAKGWLTEKRGRPYPPTADQLPLTRIFDMELAKRADSFDKMYREVVQLLTHLRDGDS